MAVFIRDVFTLWIQDGEENFLELDLHKDGTYWLDAGGNVTRKLFLSDLKKLHKALGEEIERREKGE